MSLYVVDANVVAKWFVPERLSEEAVRLLDEQHELASRDLLWPEIGNVLGKKCRTGRRRARRWPDRPSAAENLCGSRHAG